MANERTQQMTSERVIFIICYFLSTSTVNSEDASCKKDLYIGGFFGVNISENGAWSSAALIPALEMALDHVNNDSNVLVEYQLKYVWRDSKVKY